MGDTKKENFHLITHFKSLKYEQPGIDTKQAFFNIETMLIGSYVIYNQDAIGHVLAKMIVAH